MTTTLKLTSPWQPHKGRLVTFLGEEKKISGTGTGFLLESVQNTMSARANYFNINVVISFSLRDFIVLVFNIEVFHIFFFCKIKSIKKKESYLKYFNNYLYQMKVD